MAIGWEESVGAMKKGLQFLKTLLSSESHRIFLLARVPTELFLQVGLSIGSFRKAGQRHFKLFAANFADRNGGSAATHFKTLRPRFGIWALSSCQVCLGCPESRSANHSRRITCGTEVCLNLTQSVVLEIWHLAPILKRG